MKSISCILVIFIGLGVCNAFGKVEYLPMPQNQPVDERTKSKVLSAFGKLPLHFVANQGQLDPSVVYYAKSEGATVYCTEEGLVFSFAEGSISLKFSENRRVKPEARGELEGKVNYFIGNDPALWRTNIPTFSEVVYRNVYPGIDLVYSGDQRRLKYTFYLQPNSHPNQILMIYDGIEGVWVDEETGELVIQTEWGEMRDAAPVAYQEIEGVRKAIDISFRLMGEKRVGFVVGDYDPNFMLTLDPGYSTYLGGSGFDTGIDIAVDSSGNAYVTGYTYSSNFPTENAYDSSLSGSCDAFVTKLSSSGTLSYSTYLGGSSSDAGYSIAVYSSGENVYACVTGFTDSSDFPTKNAYQGDQGGRDTFVTKLNNAGNDLLYSTYLGGSGADWHSHGIAVGSSGNVYIASQTNSTDFPTKNAYQSSNAGGNDIFVTKIDTTQSGVNSLIYSTYLGGSSNDDGAHIALDSQGNVYVTGVTDSSDFPTQNPYQGDQGDRDVFVTKLSFSDSTLSLSYSTYLGGSGNDSGVNIAVDSSYNAYVTGLTQSSNFPTQNAYDSSLGGSQDAFVTKLSFSDSTLSLSYSTYLGGSSDDSCNAIAVDGAGNAYVSGHTNSSDFPTKNAYQGTYGGNRDAFVTWFNSDGTALRCSTYLGGSGDDLSNYGIAVDSSGNAYVTGCTNSSDFPTVNPYQGSNAGDYDAFVASYTPCPDCSLPVELSLLTATASADGVIIRWRTETEVNNVGFSIYRSEEKDGNYTEVAFIRGAGNSGMPNDYQFMDANVEPGKTYFYYLEDIDIFGEKNRTMIIKVVVPPAKPVEPIPKEFQLLQNYPNPFNPDTWLPYELAKDATVTIRIYDVNGQLVHQLDLGKQKAGSYVDKAKAAYWDGRNEAGEAVSSSIYFYEMRAGSYISVRKATLLK